MVEEKLDQMYKVIKLISDLMNGMHDSYDLSDFHHEMSKLNDMMTPVAITKEMVTDLQNKTGEGITTCRVALRKFNGDTLRAYQYLANNYGDI